MSSAVFLAILTQVTLPIIAIALLGMGAQRVFRFDRQTLGGVVLNVILPCFLFHAILTTPVTLGEMGFAAWFTVLQFVIMMGVGWGAAWLVRVPADLRLLVALACAFPNSGNFGIPLVELAFGKALAAPQVVMSGLHAVLLFFACALLLAPAEKGLRALKAPLAVLRMPVFPAMIAALLLRALEIEVPDLALRPLGVVGAALAPMALFVLGAQLADSDWRGLSRPVVTGGFLKLVGAPLVTYGLLLAIDAPGRMESLLIVGAAVPVGVLLAVQCEYYRYRPDMAAATIVATTVLSPLIVTLALAFAGP